MLREIGRREIGKTERQGRESHQEWKQFCSLSRDKMYKHVPTKWPYVVKCTNYQSCMKTDLWCRTCTAGGPCAARCTSASHQLSEVCWAGIPSRTLGGPEGCCRLGGQVAQGFPAVSSAASALCPTAWASVVILLFQQRGGSRCGPTLGIRGRPSRLQCQSHDHLRQESAKDKCHKIIITYW